jgi:hypothetical protein
MIKIIKNVAIIGNLWYNKKGKKIHTSLEKVVKCTYGEAVFGDNGGGQTK